MESGVEPLTHDESFASLDCHLVVSQGLEQNEGDGGVEAESLVPDGEESGTHGVREVTLSYVKEVGCRVATNGEQSCLPKTLSVVKAVHDRKILLPLVGSNRPLKSL